jgi:hypothetical protein
LAEQTSNQIKNFKKYLESPQIRDLLVIGGVNVKEQISTLQNVGADIIVGTPWTTGGSDTGWILGAVKLSIFRFRRGRRSPQAGLYRVDRKAAPTDAEDNRRRSKTANDRLQRHLARLRSEKNGRK